MIKPSAEFTYKANLQADEYNKLIQEFNLDPHGFWLKLSKEITWFKEPKQSLEYKNKPFFTWFADGQLNITYNCLDRHLPKYANKTAVIFEGELGEVRKLSYQELYDEVCKAANMLKSFGIRKGDHVCIYMGLSPEAIIAMLACLRIGAIHSVIFAGFSAHALRDRIEDLHAKFIITADGLFRKGTIVNLLATVMEACQGLSFIEKIFYYDRTGSINHESLDTRLIEWQEAIDKQSTVCEPELLNSEDTSFILYTSGSTGKPKGIKHSSGGYNLWTYLSTKWVFDIKPNDVYWSSADIGWITGHSYVVYGPLASAATIFIYEGAPNYPDPSRFWSMIEKHQINIFYTAPTAIRAFMQWGDEYPKKYDLSSLRLLGSVGEPINPAAWQWFYEIVGKSLCPIVDTWWQTETGGIMITTLPGIQEMKPGSAGLALPGVDVRINEEGLLYLASPVPSMTRGIHGDDLRYIETYWSKIPGAYTAGDAATQDEHAYITISGRVDDVINVSGHRLGTAEIESALVAHDLISEAAVVSIPHPLKGEGIIAYVVLKFSSVASGSTNLEEEFKAQVIKEIGALARPERIIICSGLPKTRSGKIMRRLLKEIAQGKVPSGDISTLENKSVLDELLNSHIAN